MCAMFENLKCFNLNYLCGLCVSLILLSHFQVYEKVGSEKITAESIIAEFNVQYPGEDLELVFGSSSEYDDTRKVKVTSVCVEFYCVL